MYRIRFHGRGGQGMKTASRILGSAFFLAGYEVQDAPRYGAERRGAPIFAYVRADQHPINERGVIRNPDLVIVADDSLLPVPAAGILQGLSEHTVLLLNSHENAATWRHRLNIHNPIVILSAAEETVDRAELKYVGATCAGAAAALLKVISKAVLTQAINEELHELPQKIIDKNLAKAAAAFDSMADYEDVAVVEGKSVPAQNYQSPQWVDLPFEQARISAPTIHAGLTSVEVRTGLWRTLRPVIDYDLCKRCWWVCSSFCPDGAINVIDGTPQIDYDHCKGCMVCLAQCPPHAIGAIAESQAQEQEQKLETKETQET
ncbi:MAG: 2-oxoacid:acceptor oxidoreductase family protein [Gammaproteobacteria bacterium]